eukprot:m.265300 g.265300  ORF g.265300 m.265300 type:complete len:402 (-) comp61093_c0_seq1:225-1430(-)
MRPLVAFLGAVAFVSFGFTIYMYNHNVEETTKLESRVDNDGPVPKNTVADQHIISNTPPLTTTRTTVPTSTVDLSLAPCRDKKYPIFEPHSGEDGVGDICRDTMGAEWQCPIGCRRAVGERTSMMCENATEPCRVSDIHCSLRQHTSRFSKWPIGIPRRLHFVRKEPTPESKLVDNVNRTVSLFRNESRVNAPFHEPETIQVWTDVECEVEINATMPALLTWFKKEEKGMYKADICRYVVLYRLGGLYVDDDIGFIESPWAPLECRDEFLTPLEKDGGGIFQAYMAVRAHHAVLLQTLKLMLADYEAGGGAANNRKHLKKALSEWTTSDKKTGVRYLYETKMNSKDRHWKPLGTNCNCAVRNDKWNVFFLSHVYPSHSCWLQPKWDFCTDDKLPLSVPLEY